jgi:hypothetical protein
VSAPLAFQVGHAANGVIGTLDEMLAANKDDESFCEWLRTAKPGDEHPDGEGCVCLESPQE